jgi:flagellar motor switch protein FliM
MGQQTTRTFQPTEVLGPGHVRRLRGLHEGLAGDFGAALSDLLRWPVDVRLSGVDQITYGEFVSALETPSYFALLKAEPLDDRLMLDVEPSILYAMIDRMLGGGRENEPPPRRPLSDIELPLAARIARLFLHHLRQAWKGVLDLKFDILRVESNPRLLRVLPSDEMVVLVGLQLRMGDLQGMMRLCLPCRAIQRMGEGHRQGRPHFNAGTLAGADVASADASGIAANHVGNEAALVEMEVTLATTKIEASELDGLRVGDIIATETDAGSPAIVSIGGEAKFRAKPGVLQGRKAVRLSEAIEDASAK